MYITYTFYKEYQFLGNHKNFTLVSSLLESRWSDRHRLPLLPAKNQHAWRSTWNFHLTISKQRFAPLALQAVRDSREPGGECTPIYPGVVLRTFRHH